MQAPLNRHVRMWRVRFRFPSWSPLTTTRVRYFVQEVYARRFAERVLDSGGDAELHRASAPIRWEIDQ